MGVGEDFKKFRDRYIIDPSLISSISARYRRITHRLNSDFWATSSETAHSRYIGSYGRDTAAKGVSDIDVLFDLPYEVWKKYSTYSTNGQSALLQAVRNSIQKTYQNTIIKGDGQVVVIKFNDGITFEILPAFENTDGSITFADANGGGTWRTCNPKSEMTAFSARNVAVNDNLKSLARMSRIWRDQHGVPISGMLLDTIAFNFIENWPHSDKSYLYHDYLIRDFLSYLSRQSRQQSQWRAPGSGSWVWRTGTFEARASAGHDLAVAAIQYQTAGQRWSAIQNWRKLFGSTYPND